VEIVKRLAQGADVFVQNYRPGVAERLGLGYDALRAVNPRLIYCSVSGFGGTGPYAPRGGYDLIAQGMSGIISVTGEEGAPAKSGVPLSDLCAGLFAAYGILCALEHRERTGAGQLVDTSLLEAAMALTVWEATEYWVTGKAPRPLGSAHRLTAPYQALRAADGYFTVGANNDKLFEALCRALERPDLLEDPRFPGAGPITALGVPVKLSDTPGAVDRAAPLLGQHTAEILTELGYSHAEQRELEAKGVI